MGLIGLLSTLICGGIVAGESISDSSYRRSRRQEAINEGKPYYVCNGSTYSVRTGKKCFISNGNVIDTDLNIVCNTADVDAEKKRRAAKAAGKRWYRRYWYPTIYSKTPMNICVDMETGKMFNIKHEYNKSSKYFEMRYFEYYEPTEQSPGYKTVKGPYLTEEELEIFKGAYI